MQRTMVAGDLTTQPIAAGHRGTGSIRFDRVDMVKAVVLVGLFFAVFWDLLDFIGPKYGSLVFQWMQADWSHGPVIPLFSAYLVYLNWDKYRASPIRHTWVGALVLLTGLAVYQWSLWGLQFAIAKPIAMLVCVLGIVIFLCGLPVMRHAWVPWLYLFFAIPLPQRIYFELTNPLRQIAAEAVVLALGWIPSLDRIERVGSMIEYTYQGRSGGIGVADACSGMRSMITLCALGTAVVFMQPRPWWHRVIMIAACVPIATFCNFIRVIVTSCISIFGNAKYATGMYHTLLGLFVLLLAFGVFLGLGWVLANLFVESSDDDAASGNGPPRRSAAREGPR
jgi:exosortase